MKHTIVVPHLLVFLLACAALLAGGLLAPGVAQAQSTEPSIIVTDTTTVHIDGSATSFTLPIIFNAGDYDDLIGLTTFTLDYPQVCLRINDVDTDVALAQTGGGVFALYLNNNADDGKLFVSIWQPLAPLTGKFSDGALVNVTFTLEPACRPGPSNLTDPTAAFAFVTPGPTFGTLLGAPVAGTATGGTYTLDINQAPTDIAAGSLAMAENVAESRQVAVLSATDSDTAPADTLTYALSSECVGANDNQGFAVAAASTTTASLSTDRVFNYEIDNSYDVCFKVTDGQGGAYTEKLTLSVTDANDTPTDVALSANVIAETAITGTVVGNLSKSDEDAGQTYTYALVAGEGDTDNASFSIDGAQLEVNTTPIFYATQPEYKVRIQVTDNGSPNKSFAKQFRLRVAGTSVLALPADPDLPVVLDGQRITVPVAFTPSGNNVLTATFNVEYNTDCLDYAGLGDIQSGFADSAADDDDDGTIEVGLSDDAPLAAGSPVSLVFTGTVGAECANADAWTTLVITDTPAASIAGAGGVAFNLATVDGQLIVLDDDPLGDCNDNHALDAGDFAATSLEIFDAEDRGASTLPANSWLWTPLGGEDFSARGCDSNADRVLGAGDLTCTILRYFDNTYWCGAGVAASGAAEPAVLAAPAVAPVSPGQATVVPLSLESRGYAVSAFAASITFDPRKLVLDRTDGDGDGLPDAVHFQLPDGTQPMVFYTPATGRIDLVATGVMSPMPTFGDGVIVTLDLKAAPGAGTDVTAVTLSNLSLGDSTGGAVPVVAATLPAPAARTNLFLPAIVH